MCSVPPELPVNAFTLAEHIAAGKSIAACQQLTGLTEATIHTICDSPLFKAEVARIRKENADRALIEAEAVIEEDAPDNVDFLKRVRDGDEEDDCDGKVMRVRLKASELLLRRQVGPKKAKEPNARVRANGAVIDVEPEDYQLMNETLKEARAPVIEEGAALPPPSIQPMSLHELVREAEELEREAS